MPSYPPDWEVVRIAVVAPPYEFDTKRLHRQKAFSLVVFGLIRSETSNIDLAEVQLVGGKMEPGEKRKDAAQRKIYDETGLDTSQRNIRFVDNFRNEEGDKTILTHLYLLDLAKHPERMSFPSGQNLGATWLGSYDGINIISFIRNKQEEIVLKYTYAFNTWEMIQAALKLRNQIRRAQ